MRKLGHGRRNRTVKRIRKTKSPQRRAKHQTPQKEPKSTNKQQNAIAGLVHTLAKEANQYIHEHPRLESQERSPLETLASIATRCFSCVWLPAYVLHFELADVTTNGGLRRQSPEAACKELPELSETELDCVLAAHAKRKHTWLVICASFHTSSSNMRYVFVGEPCAKQWTCIYPEQIDPKEPFVCSAHETLVQAYFREHGVSLRFVQTPVFSRYPLLAAFLGETKTSMIDWHMYLVLLLAAVIDHTAKLADSRDTVLPSSIKAIQTDLLQTYLDQSQEHERIAGLFAFHPCSNAR